MISQHTSFRLRLLLAFTAIVMLSLMASSWYFSHLVGRNMAAEAKRDAISHLDLVASMLERAPMGDSSDGLEAWLGEAALRWGMGFTYVTHDGLTVLEAGVGQGLSVEKSVGQVQWPEEIHTAMNGRLGLRVVKNTTNGQDCILVARPITPGFDLPDGVLRVSMPYSHTDSLRDSMMGGMLLGAGAILAVGVCLSFILARQLSMQISSMSQVAEAIGHGDYAKRLRHYPGKEFAFLAKSINQMAESIQAQILTITVQKEQLIAILDNMKEGVMLLGKDGRIRAVNHALTDIFPGIETAQGRTPLEAIMEPRLQQACEAVLGAVPDPDAGPTTLQLEPRRGQVYEVGIVALRERQAGLGAVVVFHDISRLKHLERIRRDFVANVSHELRTPLTSIKGYAETLQADPQMPGASKNFLDIIVKNANHMAKIVGDLLNLSRLEAGRDSLEASVIDASAALLSAHRECEPLGRSRNVTLDNQLPVQGPWVLADYDRLVQVFRNLVENAFRYSPQGGLVTVTAETAGGEAVFGVSDRGPGIPADDRNKIFERFYRVEKHRTKSGLPGSSGLGLAITKHIVERHGGRIWAVSPAQGADTGATFYFTIPLANDTADAVAAMSAADTPGLPARGNAPGSPETTA